MDELELRERQQEVFEEVEYDINKEYFELWQYGCTCQAPEVYAVNMGYPTGFDVEVKYKYNHPDCPIHADEPLVS